MGPVKVPKILRFPNDDGFLFNPVWGKTLRDGDNNVFGIKRNPQTKICPVQRIEHYMAVAQQLRIDLTRGYLFRPTTPQGGILDAPFSSTAAEARLKGYLRGMGSDNGETLHGFRAGCAITLALSGAEFSEIMDHVGWTRRHTALHYLTIIIMEFTQRLYIAFLGVLQYKKGHKSIINHKLTYNPTVHIEKFIAYTS